MDILKKSILENLNLFHYCDEYVYHFTDKNNLESIAKYGGIYSWLYLQNHKIHINNPGGNQFSRELDSEKGLENYCRLSFEAEHPMIHCALSDGRIQHPVILEINPVVLFFENTLYTDLNANDKDSSHPYSNFWDLLEGYEKKCRDFPDYKLDQAEILVKQFIPIELFSKKTLDLLRDL